MNVVDYCRAVPNANGCQDGGGGSECCNLPTVSCLACSAKISENEYCLYKRDTLGCP